MPGWEELLTKYGSNQVWQNTRKDFSAAVERLAALGMPVPLETLCRVMAEQGLALEHEAVWLA